MTKTKNKKLTIQSAGKYAKKPKLSNAKWCSYFGK